MNTGPSLLVKIVALLAALAAMSVGAWLLVGTTPRSAPAAGDAYSVFEDGARPAEPLQIASLPNELDLSTARVIDQAPGRVVYAVKSNGSPCLVIEQEAGSGMGCAAAPDGVPNPDATAMLAGYNGAFGLVPDSVKSVTFTMTDGSTAKQRVINNAWHSPPEAKKVEFGLHGHTKTLYLMERSSLPEGAKLCDNGLVTSKGSSCTLN